MSDWEKRVWLLLVLAMLYAVVWQVAAVREEIKYPTTSHEQTTKGSQESSDG